ncbi:MAG: biosynthetic-type acetolactate synthase large subunit, partial [Pseudomonadales bacterium]|nr:biosynthetic-type acetolactate synthase large subunit [Pseudomonadales bacterium]
QETDMIGISRPIVKHSYSVKHPSEIPGIVKKAFHIAESGRPGPVVIDIPKDMTNPTDKFEYSFPKTVKMRSYNPVAKGHSGQIKKAFDLLMAAKRPIIYAGGGVIIGRACEELIEIAKTLNYPVTNTLMGLGGYPGTDRQSVGMLGMHGSYEANMTMHHSDLIFAVGVRFDDRVTNGLDKFCPTAKIIHIDIDPTTISKTVRADVPIVGPAKIVLQDFLKLIKSSKKQPDTQAIKTWWHQIDEWRARHGGRFLTDDTKLMKPQQVIQMLSKVTNGDAFVCSDVGQHQMFAAQYYKFNKPNRWINSGGLGTMGFGFPAAMGVKLNFPDADVACVTGEGSIQMNIQELSTCSQYNIPIKIICLNNGSLGMVRQWQDMNYESRHSHSYMESLPDFVKLAEAYGHVGMKVESFADLEGAMTDAFAMKDKLVFMDITVDPFEHVYPMQIPRGSMRDMLLSKTERT